MVRAAHVGDARGRLRPRQADGPAAAECHTPVVTLGSESIRGGIPIGLPEALRDAVQAYAEGHGWRYAGPCPEIILRAPPVGQACAVAFTNDDERAVKVGFAPPANLPELVFVTFLREAGGWRAIAEEQQRRQR